MSSGRSDGTAAGTRLAKDINPVSAGSHPGPLAVFDCAWPVPLPQVVKPGLWKVTAASPGVELVRDIYPHDPGPDFLKWPRIHDVMAVGERLFFTAREPAHGLELWASDGTTAGTGEGQASPPAPPRAAAR